MKKLLCLLMLVFLVGATQAVVIVSENFDSGYVTGDLAGQNGWFRGASANGTMNVIDQGGGDFAVQGAAESDYFAYGVSLGGTYTSGQLWVRFTLEQLTSNVGSGSTVVINDGDTIKPGDNWWAQDNAMFQALDSPSPTWQLRPGGDWGNTADSGIVFEAGDVIVGVLDIDNQSAAMWVNPDASDFIDASYGSADAVILNNSKFGGQYTHLVLNGRNEVDQSTIYDDIIIGTTAADVDFRNQGAHSPVPDGSGPVDSLVTSAVSWYSPEEDMDGNFVDDPEIVSVTYDVYWSTTEPNYLIDTPVSPGQSAQSYTPTPAITFGTTYFWKVNANVLGANGVSTISDGQEWQFTTLAEYLPPVITGDDNALIPLDSLPANISAVVSGNSDPITSVVFTLLDTDFEFPAGATASISPAIPGDFSAPDTELTTDMPGKYKVHLFVSDGITDVETFIEVVVTDDVCQAQKDLGGWVANYYDRDENCLVDLNDFVVFAAEWLDFTGLDSQVSYAGDVISLDLDVVINAIDAYAPTETDPNYVSEAPLEIGTGSPRISLDVTRYGGGIIAYTGADDYVTYEIDVPAAGTYTVYVVNSYPGGTVPTASFGTDVDPALYGAVALPSSTAWSDWRVDSGTLTFASAGVHLVRVTWVDAAFNLDFIGLKQD